jgi:hypothetical protein
MAAHSLLPGLENRRLATSLTEARPANGPLHQAERRAQDELMHATDYPQGRFSAEDLGYWFFRLNGCLTTRNFVLHPETHGSQLTDADLLGLRFPYRQEQQMRDHSVFDQLQLPTLLFVEIKTGRCHFNGPWTSSDAHNLDAVLQAVGAFPVEEIRSIAKDLYKSGFHHSRTYDVLMVAVGSELDPDLSSQLPGAVQLTWDTVIEFIFGRMVTFLAQKADAPQWDESGRLLHRLGELSRTDPGRFAGAVRSAFMLKS